MYRYIVCTNCFFLPLEISVEVMEFTEGEEDADFIELTESESDADAGQ